MLRSLSTAISGLRAHQTMMDVLSNDLANVNTVGYKASRASFKDTLAQTVRAASGAGGGLGSVNGQQIGLGTQIGSIENQMTQGAISPTGNPFDLAIQGEGFFRLTDDIAGFTGLQFSRAGNFQLDEAGRLVNADGYFVVGFAVNPGPPPSPDTATQTAITVPANTRAVSIDQNGKVRAVDAAGVATDIAYLSLAKFPNAQGLERSSNNRWIESAASGVEAPGAANTAGIGSINSGALELSNVDVAQEFSEMILAQRGLQANSRIITTDDEILQVLVQMKR